MTEHLPIRVATAGTGYFSRFQYEAWSRMADVDLVAVCNRSEEPARAIASEYGIDGVFNDFGQMLDAVNPDLVDIITPPVTHLDYVREAAARRIPMICQKPFCQTFDEAQAAVAAAAETGTLLVVHENFRFQPWYEEIKRRLTDGALGTIYQVTFRLRPGDGQGAAAYLDRQPYFQKMERFLVHETAIHLIDVFRYLLGDVAAVSADLRRLNPAIAGEDAGLIVFTFENGARGLFDGNRLSDHIAENRRLTMGEMILEGEKGVIRLTGDGRLWLREHGSNAEAAIEYPWDNRGFAGDCVYRLQRHVIDHLRHGTPVMNKGADYLANIALEEAVYRSDAERRWIVVGDDS